MNALLETYKVESFKVPFMVKKLEKLNRKASKLGISQSLISIGKEYPVEEETIINCKKVKITKYYNDISLNYNPIKVGEYTFCGTIDHQNVGGNIINVVPGQSIPEVYYNSDCSCDHCNINRFRKETFIFKDNNGYKKVGRSCLKDFFGIDPSKEIEVYFSLNDTMQDEDSWGISYTERHFNTKEIVMLTMAIVKELGYCSRSKAAEQEKTSTTSHIFNVLFPDMKRREEVNFSDKFKALSVDYADKADEVIAWGIEHFGNQKTEYAHNMSVFLQNEKISTKYFGYVASLIPAYAYYLDQVKPKQEKPVSKFVGCEKDKLSLKVVVNKVIPSQSFYGVSYITIMTDDSGNKFVWFASSDHGMEEGNEYNIKGTVKGHNERNGEKQTVLTRVKVS